MTTGDVLARLDATLGGLSDEQAARRRSHVGSNRLALAKPTSPFTILVDQLTSDFSEILLLARS